MIPGLNPANQQFITSVENLNSQLSNTQVQLSTGYRVNQASDAPEEIGDIFETRADLANVNQVTQNLNNVQAQVNAGDSSVQAAIQVLQSAITLGTQSASGTTSPAEFSSGATEAQGLLAQLVSLSNTQVNGVYIFSGDASGSAPYQLDATSPTGVDQLVTAQDTLQIADPTGLTFQIGQTAATLFDNSDANGNPTPQNAFAAVNSLITALQNSDTNGVSQAISSLQSASDYLNGQLAFYGAAQNRISSAIDLASKFQVQYQTQLSNLVDTNVPAAALQLTQESTDISAAMSAESRRPTTTLFDYLPLG